MEISYQFKNNSKYDLVFSQGTIDNCYDMNRYIINMINLSKKYVYITAYRGWFPKLDEHQYSWNDDHKCCYNNLSVKEITKLLKRIKKIKFFINPLNTNRKDITKETKIIIIKS